MKLRIDYSTSLTLKIKNTSVHKAYLDACINKQDTLESNHIDFENLETVINAFKRLRGLRRVSDYELSEGRL